VWVPSPLFLTAVLKASVWPSLGQIVSIRARYGLTPGVDGKVILMSLGVLRVVISPPEASPAVFTKAFTAWVPVAGMIGDGEEGFVIER